MRISGWTGAAVLAGAIGLAGCQGLGNLGDIIQPAPGGTSDALVEVQGVDQNRQQIIVRTEQGEQGGVYYDNRTRVIYDNQEYPVTALERGDIVAMRIHTVQEGYYTDLIEVRQSVQERTGATTGGNLHRLEGTVGEVNRSTYSFVLEPTAGGQLVVRLPSNATTSQRDRVLNMRTGDYVRVEARAVSQTTVELVRFGWSN